MRTTKSKTQNTQLPDQVVAVNRLNDLIVSYFDIFSLECNNDTLMQLVSAICGPDPRAGKRSPISIAGTVDEVTQIISLVRKCQVYFGSIFIDDASSAILVALSKVSKLDIDVVETTLLSGLVNWIYQDDHFEDSSLSYSKNSTKIINKLYKWLAVASEYNHKIVLSKGGLSC